jgi:hypothetical protein
MHIGLYGNQAKYTGQCHSISDPRGKTGPCDSTHLPASEQTNILFHAITNFVGTADGGTAVKVLRYKSEGRWFDSRWCHWNFSLT